MSKLGQVKVYKAFNEIFENPDKEKKYNLKVSLSKPVEIDNLYSIISIAPPVFIFSDVVETEQGKNYVYTVPFKAYKPIRIIKDTLEDILVQAYKNRLLDVQIEAIG